MTRTVFAGGEVFDGTGAPPVRADIAVEEGRIAEVGTGLSGDVVHDVAGRLVVPGLIDCHAHVLFDGMDVVANQQQPFSLQFYEAERNLRTVLASGVTTIRDAGGIDLGVKTALERGMIRGPRALIAITVLS